MLREVPAFTPPMHESIMPLTEDDDDFEPTTDALDDIFGSAPNSPSQNPETTSDTDMPLTAPDASVGPIANSERSDIPRLRSTHVTNGYRDGIADSKARYVQEGFDEGFSLGAVLGLEAGWLLGVLEGVVRALNSDDAVEDSVKRGVRDEYLLAREELGLRSLFGREYFGEDGIWTFEVEGEDVGGEVTFREVAAAHPVLKKWVGRLRGVQESFGIDLQSRARPEQGSDEE